MPVPARMPDAAVTQVGLLPARLRFVGAVDQGVVSSPSGSVEHGLRLRCPDFNEPDFTTLTMTRMLEQLEREMARRGTAPVDAHRLEPGRHAGDSRRGAASARASTGSCCWRRP